ncbi:serine hydroxymethyltransferase [Neorhizobium sp. NCHU2750]|uniref:serine hydroxymethyltransferase n=1 Tax=Neorhizobium sp. NCHU2750 TaxID=1825976 RepID=UPI000E73DF61|nr:glycine hydroxymethyltransferase [Neorhizobium sp. NCHU2750]
MTDQSKTSASHSAWMDEQYFTASLHEADAEIAALADSEMERQRNSIELIASENFVSRAVLDALGSVFCNKTVVGYPGRRFHAGAHEADALERLAVSRACAAFGSRFANVQPHSGIQANLAVFRALVRPDQTVLSLSGAEGGHFSHGGAANLSGSMAKAVYYHTDSNGLIDYDALEALAREHQPRMIVTGGAAYPREIDYPRLRAIADLSGALLMADIAHFAGLVVARCTADPFPHCDIVTTTTYKSLRGTRGGIILTNDEKIAEALEKATSPGVQGSPLLHAIAGKAVCLGEALRPSFAAYGRAVLANARALASELQAGGTAVLTGGTDTPLVIADLRQRGLKGQPMVEALDRAGITCNRCEIPGDDTDPAMTSGLRFGVSAATTRGLGTAEMIMIARAINRLLEAAQAGGDLGPLEAQIAGESRAMMADFPLYKALA